MPAKDPSNKGNWKHKVDVAAITMKCSHVQVRHVYGVCTANCTVGTESDEVPLIVAADAARGEKAVVVADSNAVPTQWAVVRTRRHVYPAVGTVPPVAARQCVITDVLAVTVVPPDKQKIPQNLQHAQRHTYTSIHTYTHIMVKLV